MKLLLDNNLSHRLVARIADLYPEPSHVMTVGLDEAEDEEIWNYAKKNHFTIVTKNADYDDLSLIRGSPPKVIWLKVGNCRIGVIESIIRNNVTALNNFIQSDAGIMEINPSCQSK
jgi:predicted nuclease of predicted toxin-antitoxin system